MTAATDAGVEAGKLDKPEPIIPLILAPDDPGPEAVEENEPHDEKERRLAEDFRVGAAAARLLGAVLMHYCINYSA